MIRPKEKRKTDYTGRLKQFGIMGSKKCQVLAGLIYWFHSKMSYFIWKVSFKGMYWLEPQPSLNEGLKLMNMNSILFKLYLENRLWIQGFYDGVLVSFKALSKSSSRTLLKTQRSNLQFVNNCTLLRHWLGTKQLDYDLQISNAR